MAELVKCFWLGLPVGLYIILILAFGLGVAGFIVPPLGVISGTVLEAMGIVLGATWIYYCTVHLPEILAAGIAIRGEYKGAKIEIANKENNEEKEEK